MKNDQPIFDAKKRVCFFEKKSRAEYNRLVRLFKKNPDMLSTCCMFTEVVGGWRFIYVANETATEESVKHADLPKNHAPRTALKEYALGRILAARGVSECGD